MKTKKVLACTFTAWLLAAMCVSCNNKGSQMNLTEVWVKDGWPPVEMAAPSGFQITPRSAFKIVAESKKLSPKHKWICYRDEVFYYVADAFIQPSKEKTAIQYGIRINGQTGAVE